MTRKEIERMVETAQIEEYRWHCFCDREGTTLARVVEDVELFDEWDALNDMDARTLRSLIYARVHRICETPPDHEAVKLLRRIVAFAEKSAQWCGDRLTYAQSDALTQFTFDAEEIVRRIDERKG